MERQKTIIFSKKNVLRNTEDNKNYMKTQKIPQKSTPEIQNKENLSMHNSFVNFDPTNIRASQIKNTKIAGKTNENSFKSGQMKEIIEILKNISEKNQTNLFPNIFILGSKKIGKSSMIETLTGCDLFPPELINLPVKVTISNNYKNESFEKNDIENSITNCIETIKSEDKNFEENINIKEAEPNILIYCDHSFFTSIEKFHERLNERPNQEVGTRKFLEIKLSLPGKFHPVFPFDLSIYEIPTEYVENLNSNEEINSLFSGRNSIFLVLIGYDHLEKLDHYKHIISKYDANFESTIFIVNKSDLIENRNEAICILDKLKNLQNQCFIRNRKLEERKSKTMTIQDYYEEEKKFFETSKIFSNLETTHGVSAVFEMINLIFKEKIYNQVSLEEFNLKKQQNEKILHSLCEPILDDEKSKRHYITNLLKNTILSIKDSLGFNKNCFTHFFDYCYKIKKEVKNNSQFENMNKYISSNIFKDLKNFEQNCLKLIDLTSNKSKMILLEFNNEKQTKQELENHIFTNVKIIFGKLCDQLSNVFKKFEENLLIEISLIINNKFSYIDDNFVILVKELFFKTLTVEYENFVYYCSLNKEIETNIFYNKNIQTIQKITNLYEILTKSGFSVTIESINKLEELLRDIISSNLFTFLESYSKSYSYFFLEKCIEKIENISLIDIDFSLFKESEEVITMRKSLMDETHSLDRLIQLLDKTERLKKILPQNIVDKNLTSSIPQKVESESNTITYKNSKILKENETVMIWDSTDFISVFSFKEWKITKEQVKGIPYKTFLENNRFIQNNDKVYITGGLYNDSPSNLFICLERPNNTISKLKELPIKVVRQSLVILRHKYIVLVGGTRNTNCFIYNIQSDSWNQIQTLNEPHEDGTLFVLNNEYIFCLGGKLTKSHENLLEYIQFNNEYEYFSLSNLYWKTISLSNLECLNENLLENLFHLSGAGTIFLDDNILICGGYNSISSEEYNFIFSLSVNLKDQSCFESKLQKYDKSSLIMPNWFPEKIFVENNLKAFNFDVDGNMIVYDLNKGSFERIEFDFYSN